MKPTTDTSVESFESLARACGDALLVVGRHTSTGIELVVAMARLGDWAVTEPCVGDRPFTRSGKRSRAKLAIVMNVPSGLKVPGTYAIPEAMRMLRALADVPGKTREDIEANRERIGEIIGQAPFEGRCRADQHRAPDVVQA